MASTAPGASRSTASAAACALPAVSSAARSSSARCDRPTSSRNDFSRAAIRAIACPMPDEAPVTTIAGRKAPFVSFTMEASAAAAADGAGERTTDAVVAGGGIVQPVPRYEGARRQPRIDRPAHEREAREQADALVARHLGDDRLHHRVLGAGQHDRRVLQVHQNHVDTGGLEHADALNDPILETVGAAAPGHVVGAELPHDEVRRESEHVALEAGDAAADGLADAAAVDDLDARGRAQPREL